jgi:hypothetical protein
MQVGPSFTLYKKSQPQPKMAGANAVLTLGPALAMENPNSEAESLEVKRSRLGDLVSSSIELIKC